MKKNKIVATFLLSALMTTAVIGSPSSVSAGVYDNTLATEESIDGGIRGDYWWTPSSNAGIEYVDGEGIAFTEESRRASRMITINKAYNFGDYGFEECFTAEMQLKVVSVPEGGRFGFVFGLSTQMLNPAAGGVNTSFLYFTTLNNGLQIGVSNYVGAQKTETEILPATELSGKLSDITANFGVKVKVVATGGITVTVAQNGADAYVYENEAADCFTEGNLGFGQTEGGTEAFLKDINITAYKAENPGNTNILTHFEGDVFNINEFYTSNFPYADKQSYVKAENGGMVFKNTKKAYLSTRRKYSNFEAEIEIADLARDASFNEDLSFDTSISTGFTISFADSYTNAKAQNSIFRVEFKPEGGSSTRQSSGTSAKLYFGNELIDSVTLPKELHLWNKDVAKDKSVLVKVSYTDGKMKASVKFSGGYNYYEIFSRQVGNVSSGYIQVVSSVSDMTAGVCDNFKVATLSVVNTDYEKRIISLVNKDNTSVKYDYMYTDTWDDADLPFGNR